MPIFFKYYELNITHIFLITYIYIFLSFDNIHKSEAHKPYGRTNVHEDWVTIYLILKRQDFILITEHKFDNHIILFGSGLENWPLRAARNRWKATVKIRRNSSLDTKVLRHSYRDASLITKYLIFLEVTILENLWGHLHHVNI